MALTNRQVWPDAPAGTIQTTEINERRFDYSFGELAVGVGSASGIGVVSFLTQDGLSGGDSIVDLDGCPCVWEQIADSADFSAVSQMGRWGPIMDPADERLASDLFFWRWRKPGSRWQVEVYLTGLSSGGDFDTRSAGRPFIQYSMGAAP